LRCASKKGLLASKKAACLTDSIGKQTTVLYVDARLSADMTYSASRKIFMAVIFNY